MTRKNASAAIPLRREATGSVLSRIQPAGMYISNTQFVARKLANYNSLLEMKLSILKMYRSGNDRLAAAGLIFLDLGVPFSRENPEDVLPQMHWPPKKLDCITFVYHTVALAHATTPDHYVRNLVCIRFNGAPKTDNLVHFAWNCAARMVRAGFCSPITSHLLGERVPMTRSVRLGIRGNGTRFLPYAKVGDDNIGRLLTVNFLPAVLITDNAPDITSGDIIFFVSAKHPDEYPGIVWHAGLAFRENPSASLGLLHCSMSPLAHAGGPPAGVSFLRDWDHANKGLKTTGPLRTIASYLRGNPDLFAGILAFRPRALLHHV